MSKTWRDFYDAELEIMSEKMDKQDAYFQELWKFADKFGHEEIPTEHAIGWFRARLQGRKSWRFVPHIRRTVERAARKAARNRAKKESA